MDQDKAIQILRGNKLVSTYLGTFGHRIRETRLTSTLAYIIARHPSLFCNHFGVLGNAIAINVENIDGKNEDRSRSDIVVETTKGKCVIEAKVTETDPREQSTKYDARWRVLITNFIPKKKFRNTRYFTWQSISEILAVTAKSGSPETRFLSKDVIEYLEEHHMKTKKQPIEIYARDLGGEDSFKRFYEANIYYDFEKRNTRLFEAGYFAPHLSSQLCKKYPGIKKGITFVAKIRRAETFADKKSFCDTAKKLMGKAWLKRNTALLREVFSDMKKEGSLTILFLKAPRMVFNPPLQKTFLQNGRSGRLSKFFYLFEELFAAWDGEKPPAAKKTNKTPKKRRA